MQYLVKYFSEIRTKSKPVPRQFLRQLYKINPPIKPQRSWDEFQAFTQLADANEWFRLVAAMRNVSLSAAVRHVPAIKTAFLELHMRSGELSCGLIFMLQCAKRVMSRPHAGHLNEDKGGYVQVMHLESACVLP